MSNLYARLGVASPVFDPARKFVTSPVFRPGALAAIRLTLALYSVVTLIVDLALGAHSDGSYFSYFTDLAYIGLCSYLWASGVQTAAYAYRPNGQYPLQCWPRFLQFLHSLLYSSIISFAPLVTIVYWGVLSSPTTFATTSSTWANISKHAMNSAFALFEIFLTNAAPAPWLHLPFLVLVLALYLGVAYITRATQGFYVYNFLDPQKQHAKLAGWIIGIAVAEIVLFTLVRTLCLLRERVARRFGARTAYDYEYNERASTSTEGTTQWQVIEAPGREFVSV